MTVSPKMKKILATVGGSVLFIVCVVSMGKCSSNADERDDFRDSLTAQTARADSLQKALSESEDSARQWQQKARTLAGQLNDCQNDATLPDSIVVLNDSIDYLNAAKDSLQRQLNDCRGGRGAVSKKKANPVKRGGTAGSKKPATKAGSCASVQQNNVVSVPAQSSTNVNVSGGCNNTVNINNGVINNYGTPCGQDTARRVVVHASASATTVVRVVRTR